MIKVGDIVTLDDSYIGHGYLFQVSKLVTIMSNGTRFYNIKRFEQELDPRKGPLQGQINIIEGIERRVWSEKVLELIEPTPETAVKTENKNLFDTCVQGNFEEITIQGDSSQTRLLDEIKWPTISIDSSLNVFQNGKKICTINKKEENKMKDILDLYKERKTKSIHEKYNDLIKEIKEADAIQQIVQDTNRLIQDTDPSRKFPEVVLNVYTDETKEDITDMEKACNLEIDELYNLIEEVEAYFRMTLNFEERKEILKNYNIIDKKGKLNI